MRKIVMFCALLLAATQKAAATEYYSVSWEFPHFQYHFTVLCGSRMSIDYEGTWLTAARLNDYISELNLRGKPVIFSNSGDHNRPVNPVEIYEGDKAWYINLNGIHNGYNFNTRPSNDEFEDYMECYGLEEGTLAAIVEGFNRACKANEPYKPLFYGSMETGAAGWEEAIARHTRSTERNGFDKTKRNLLLYTVGDWQVRQCEGSVRVFHKGLMAEQALSCPVSVPITIHNRLILTDDKVFAVFEGGECIKYRGMSGYLMGQGEQRGNRLSARVNDCRVNFMEYDPFGWLAKNREQPCLWSYSYNKNQFIPLVVD